MTKLRIISVLLLCVTLTGVMLFSGPVAAEPPARVSGRILIDEDTPMRGGMILLYGKDTAFPFAPEQYRLLPDEVANVADDGAFLFSPHPGSYYLEAVQYLPGHETGPPRLGDLHVVGEDEEGQPRLYTVTRGERLDLGTLSGAGPDEGLPRMHTGIRGTVVDNTRKPVADVSVFAFTNPDYRGKASFISNKTGLDGRFVLGVAVSGTYYLALCDFGQFPPQTKGLDPPRPVTLQADEIRDDYVITVPEGR